MAPEAQWDNLPPRHSDADGGDSGGLVGHGWQIDRPGVPGDNTGVGLFPFLVRAALATCSWPSHCGCSWSCEVPWLNALPSQYGLTRMALHGGALNGPRAP